MVLNLSFKPDRRRQKRQLLNTSVQVFSGSAHMDALGINLSDVGMCLFSLANLPLGSQIQVEFLPPRQKERVRVRGTVRHRALYLYGVEFLNDSDPRPKDCTDAGTIADRPVRHS
jgi:PilZ domain